MTLFALRRGMARQQGSIPENIGEMTNLNSLNLGTTGLDGNPFPIANKLHNLQVLLLPNNHFTGDVPFWTVI